MTQTTTLPRLHRRGQCTLYGPTMLEAFIQGVKSDAANFPPFCKTQRHSIIRDHSIAAGVSILLRCRRPAAVFRAVISVVVNSVETMAWRWARSHVLKKCLERQPPFANDNPSPAITIESWVMSIVASLKHSGPHAILWRVVQAVRLVGAPITRSAGAVSQISSSDGLLHAASTTAQPEHGLPAVSGVRMKDGPATKQQASQVYESVAVLGRITRSHTSLLFRFGWIGPAGSHNLLAAVSL